MVHGHAPVRQQPIGRLALRAGRKDRRDRGPRTVTPRPPDAHDPIPDPTVGMRAARVFPLCPIRALVHVQCRRRADIPCRFGAQHRLPIRRQRLHPHRARHRALTATGRLPRGSSRTTLPARRPIAGAGMVGADIAVGHHRAHLVCRLPVDRHAAGRQFQHPRGQTVDPHAGQEQKAMIVDHQAQLRGPGVRRPADELVARLLVPTRSAKPNAAKAAMNRRTHPIAQLAARSPCPALRVMSRHHRLPKASVRIPRHRRQRHLTQGGKPAANRKVRIIRYPLAIATPWIERRPRCRQRKPKLVRENRQSFAR